MGHYDWQKTSKVEKINFACGYCSKETAPSKMYETGTGADYGAHIYICPNCTQPTFIDENGNQTPGVMLGKAVDGITSNDVAQLYQEARYCISVGAFTATVMVCRKILMNLAVQHSAKENENFFFYVDFLANNGFMPQQGRPWVDAIRKKGNEANHEIALMDDKDAQFILQFTEALLIFNYEMIHILGNYSKP